MLQQAQQYFDFQLDDLNIICIPKSQDTTYNTRALVLLGELKRHKQNTKYLLKRVAPATDVVAVDIETTALDPYEGDIRLVAMFSNRKNAVTENVGEVAAILQDKSILKVFHNAAFDVTWLTVKGFPVVNYTDTMVMSQVLHNTPKSANTLQSLALVHLGVSLDKSLQTDEHWQAELTNQHKAYALKDAEVTYHLYHHLQKLIAEKHLDVVVDREIRALSAVIELNRNGIYFDYEGWSTVLNELQAEAVELEQNIRSLLGCEDLNINSPKQLIEAFRSQGLEIESSADEALARYEDDHAAIQPLRKYKKLKKQLTTYGEKLKTQISPDGRLRGQWRLIGTDTSRMTCKSPNLQGLPFIAKPYVKAARGNKLIIADYSTIELRILAEITRDTELTVAFQNKEDLHAKTARAVLNKPPHEDVSDEERSIGKVVNFGLVYGMTAYGLQKKIQSATKQMITKEEAETFRNRYFELYPSVLTYQDRMLRTDFIQTLGGRYWSKNTTELKPGAISRYNYPVQGTAAEGFKEALAILMQEKPSNWKLIAAIHDEIVLEVPTEEKSEATQVLINSMKQGMQRLIPSIPMEIEVKSGKQWSK